MPGGITVGMFVGMSDCMFVGMSDCMFVGTLDSMLDGTLDGALDGMSDGILGEGAIIGSTCQLLGWKDWFSGTGDSPDVTLGVFIVDKTDEGEVQETGED
jgi:hypothetical protein